MLLINYNLTLDFSCLNFLNESHKILKYLLIYKKIKTIQFDRNSYINDINNISVILNNFNKSFASIIEYVLISYSCVNLYYCKLLNIIKILFFLQSYCDKVS